MCVQIHQPIGVSYQSPPGWLLHTIPLHSVLPVLPLVSVTTTMFSQPPVIG